MANRIARADGNWLDASTWGTAEAGTGAAQLTRSASTNTTTSYVYSSAFTGTNADVADGLLLHCKRVNTTGTVTVTLSEDNGTTATREVTVNASDLPADQAWVLFVFASTLTLDGGTDYKVGIKGSSAGNATFYRDGTAGNWARLVRLTATGAPAAADNMFIAKEWTAAATGTARTVTMNALAGSITDHGTLDIGQGGTLTFGSTAATNYYLRLSGDLNVWDGGTLNMGTVATPIPAGSTAKLNFDCGSNVQYGLILNNGGTFVAQGASKTCWTYLAADVAVNGTSLTTSAATLWADNDEIAIASTTRTYTQCEKGALNGAASGTSLTVDGFAGTGGGVAAAHSGTAPTRAEVINLTRNVQIFGASASLQTYVLINSTATVDWDYAECYWMGSGTADKRGLDVKVTTGSFNVQYCSMHNFEGSNVTIGLNLTGSAWSNVTFSNNVMYYFTRSAIEMVATSGTWTISGNVILSIGANIVPAVGLADVGGTFTNNIVACHVYDGIRISETAAVIGTFSGNTSHSNVREGIQINATLATGQTLTSISVWRNGGNGIYFNGASAANLTIDGFDAFGNGDTSGKGSSNLVVVNGNLPGLTLRNCSSNGDSTFSTTYGIEVGGSGVTLGKFCPDWVLENCDFSTVGGIKTAHTYDIRFLDMTTDYIRIVSRNCKLGGTSGPIEGLATNLPGNYLKCQKYGQVAGDHRTFYPHGTIQTDSTIYRTASPSERLTPSSASIKLESGPKRKAVNNGGTATFNVYVRKSVVGDGAAYNGAQPRLVLRKNVAAGITTDTVLDTATAASDGAWEQLTGTSGAVSDDAVLEVCVDCDGTAGWVNVDA